MFTITHRIHGMFRERLAAVVPRRHCWPKEQHDTKESAMARIETFLRLGLAKNAKRIRVYPCAECASNRGKATWHVGHAASKHRRTP